MKRPTVVWVIVCNETGSWLHTWVRVRAPMTLSFQEWKRMWLSEECGRHLECWSINGRVQ